MITEMKKRPYTLKRRAQRQEATRRRIVEAAVSLHEELGPLATTISAIAERAGVQRLTVYRHFPDEAQIFRACTSHWFANNPPPDPSGWAGRTDPAERTRSALQQLYAYYRRTRGMWSPVYRDLPKVPTLQKIMTGFDDYLDGVRADLLEVWKAGGGPPAGPAAAVLGHAVQFSTWASLAREGLSDPAMAELVSAWLAGIQASGASWTGSPGSSAPRPASKGQRSA